MIMNQDKVLQKLPQAPCPPHSVAVLTQTKMCRDKWPVPPLETYRSTSELVSYLDCDTVNHLTDDFNILNWWHQHKLTYPVLSIMAKDILTVPVSTISSESTFSMTGRIIEERRRNLKPEMVEMLTCIKDWEAAEARLQQNVEDKELEQAFEELYLD